MANSDKNIKITPNTGTTDRPEIEFVGSDNTPINLKVQDDGTVSFEGTVGQLLAIADGYNQGYFSFNDISGMPLLSGDNNGIVRVGGGFARDGYVFIPNQNLYTSSSNPYIIPNNVNWIHIEEDSSTYLRFPDAASQPGREITIRSWGQLYSADSNVVRLSDTSASSPDTFIHNSSYYYSKLVSNGTYWIVMESNYR